MSSADASCVFEQYLLESTNAIVKVARSDILNAVSVTKFGQEYHNKRAERNMSEIFGYINRLPVPGKVSMCRRNGYSCGWSSGGASTKALNKMRDNNAVNMA